jgi:heptosyltransferase III
LINPKKILIIIQRSNGDVFLSSNLIFSLYKFYDSPQIDLLVNDDTLSVAKLLPHINFIHKFSYTKKKENRWNQEKELFKSIFKKYDLSINLTASDRSVIYSLIAGKFSISAIEINATKSWWKKLLLNHYYYFDLNNHILINNSEPLKFLNIKDKIHQKPPLISKDSLMKVKIKLKQKGINEFVIFHPSAQYNYKIYPSILRNQLLKKLDKLGFKILVTGGMSKIDLKIKKEITDGENIHNFIGMTSLEEYSALCQLSNAYIGMDTLNMHIAASFNKPIFAIFGPTNISMWSPWSNKLQSATKENKSTQTYDNITIFQSSFPCKVCGLVGCGNNHDMEEIDFSIKPENIFIEVSKWYRKKK